MNYSRVTGTRVFSRMYTRRRKMEKYDNELFKCEHRMNMALWVDTQAFGFASDIHTIDNSTKLNSQIKITKMEKM